MQFNRNLCRRLPHLQDRVSTGVPRQPQCLTYSSVGFSNQDSVSKSGETLMGVIWEPALDATAHNWQAEADRLCCAHFAPLAEELDREQRYPWESIPKLVDSGLAGLFLPREYGGQVASLTATAAVAARIAADCTSTAATLCAYHIGACPLLLAGTEATEAY